MKNLHLRKKFIPLISLEAVRTSLKPVSCSFQFLVMWTNDNIFVICRQLSEIG